MTTPPVRPPRAVVLLTCEHASKSVPARYAALFEGRERLLDSHRGWDPGALELARRLRRALSAPLLAGRATRLLVDLNRPPGHAELLSPFSAALTDEQRARLVERFHTPHWRRVEQHVLAHAAQRTRVVHFGVHSFTPVRAGSRRLVDVGILFDPARRSETRLALRLRDALLARDARLRVRFNEPYEGVHPGLTSHLRTLARDPAYAGIELELNQRFPRSLPERWRVVQTMLVAAVREALA